MDNPTRRNLLLGVPALAMVSKLTAQTSRMPIRARKLSQMTLTVTNLQRSLDFYQGLFGMPVQARQGSTVLLRVGAGPQFLALQQGGVAGFHRYGLGIEGFDADRVSATLLNGGLAKTNAAPAAMQFQLRQREGAAELFMGDPDGIVAQLQDLSYCGGSGVLGNICGAVEAAPRKGAARIK